MTLALDGISGVMPVIRRMQDKPYQWDITTVPLADVANVERELPAHYIRDDGFGITDACRRYLRPLIQGEAPPAFVDGLPQYVTLKNQAIPKRLSAYSGAL